MRAIADVQTSGNIDPGFSKRLDFSYQRRRINHHAHSDHRLLLGTKNAAGDQLQNVFLFSDDDCVPGIVAAGHAHDVVERTGKVVHDLAFAFITPLRADHHHRFHRLKPFRAHTVPLGP